MPDKQGVAVLWHRGTTNIPASPKNRNSVCPLFDPAAGQTSHFEIDVQDNRWLINIVVQCLTYSQQNMVNHLYFCL